MTRPVFILGAPRTGTTLLARIIGSHDQVFLITEIEPHLKRRHCPEDQSAISDADLWREHFSFGPWRADRRRPLCERPVLDLAKLKSMRARYFRMAGAKRLAIKNPYNLTRVDMLKIMFPDAIFVFGLRAPWPTIQSATLKGNTSFLVPTDFLNSLPDDLILRAAATWAESIDVLRRDNDANWIVVRYEELLTRPREVIGQLYSHVDLPEMPAMDRAVHLPEVRLKDYSFIKSRMMGHPHRAEITALVEERAHALGYDPDLSALPGSLSRYRSGVG